MQYPMVRTVLAPLAAACLLVACGGGGNFFVDDIFEDRYSSGREGSLDVVSPQDTRFSGTYETDDVLLTRTVRVAAAGTLPATCRFQFAGLRMGDRNAYLDGEIRYAVNSTEVVTTFMAINGLSYRLDDSAAVVVNKTTHNIRFNGATLANARNPRETITVTGTIPYRFNDLPTGC